MLLVKKPRKRFRDARSSSVYDGYDVPRLTNLQEANTGPYFLLCMQFRILETKRDIGLSKKIQIHPLKPDMRTPVDNDQKVINYNETLTLEDSVDKVCVFGV